MTKLDFRHEGKSFPHYTKLLSCSLMLFLGVAFSGCDLADDPAYAAAHDYTFKVSLPPDTKVSLYRSEDDVLVLIAQFQSKTTADSFLERAGFTKCVMHPGEAASWEFEDLKRVLRQLGIKQKLKNQGWAMNRDAYTGFDGETKAGRKVQVFQSDDRLHMLFWIEARGG